MHLIQDEFIAADFYNISVSDWLVDMSLMFILSAINIAHYKFVPVVLELQMFK